MKCVLVIGCFFAAVGVMAKDGFWAALTPEQRAAAGIEHLTPAQRAALDALAERFVEAQTIHEVTAARERTRAEVKATLEAEKKARIGFEPGPTDLDAIRTRIMGEFRGWEKGTVFRLENGQIWAVADNEIRAFALRRDPDVEIRPAAFGTWKLHLLPEGLWVRVKRVK